MIDLIIKQDSNKHGSQQTVKNKRPPIPQPEMMVLAKDEGQSYLTKPFRLKLASLSWPVDGALPSFQTLLCILSWITEQQPEYTMAQDSYSHFCDLAMTVLVKAARYEHPQLLPRGYKFQRSILFKLRRIGRSDIAYCAYCIVVTYAVWGREKEEKSIVRRKDSEAGKLGSNLKDARDLTLSLKDFHEDVKLLREDIRLCNEEMGLFIEEIKRSTENIE